MKYERRDARGRFTAADPEIRSIVEVQKALRRLHGAAQIRVVVWAIDYCGCTYDRLRLK